MTYYAVLWITILSGPLADTRMGIIYPTEAACEAATTAVSDTLAYDHSLTCEATATASASIRPKGRP